MIFYLGNVGKLEDVELLREHGMGAFLTATGWRSPKEGLRYALDNGAYSAFMNGTQFDAWKYEAFIRRHMELETTPDFCVTPDIVCGGLESLAFSVGWRQQLLKITGDWGKWYLAIQDGMTEEDVDLAIDQFDGVFIGGSLNWKLLNGSLWVKYAHKRGLPAHIGRVGIPSRILWARTIWADSVDSTTPARGFGDRLPAILYAMNEEDPQAKLFEESR